MSAFRTVLFISEDLIAQDALKRRCARLKRDDRGGVLGADAAQSRRPLKFDVFAAKNAAVF
jgi:hypothetical protein